MICRSPLPDVEIPDLALADFVLEHAAERGDKPALIDGPSGRPLSHAEVAERVRRLAGALAAGGVAAGDVVALCAPNSPEYAIAFHAIAAAGACVRRSTRSTPSTRSPSSSSTPERGC
jgi:acyl-CoA synthetase (AMP-forming)/AMP-acid ligase II